MSGNVVTHEWTPRVRGQWWLYDTGWTNRAHTNPRYAGETVQLLFNTPYGAYIATLTHGTVRTFYNITRVEKL